MKHPIYIACFLLFLCSSHVLRAGDAADSLSALGWKEDKVIEWLEERIRSAENKEPRTLYEWYFDLSERYTDDKQWDKGLYAVEQCIAIGIENGWEADEMFRDAVSDKGAYLLELDRIRAAERWIRGYIDEEVGDWRYVKLCMLYAGVLETLGDLTLAEDYLLKALDVSREIGNDRYTSRTLVRLSQLYFKTEDFTGAQSILEMLNDEEISVNSQYEMSIKYNLSAVFLEAGEFKRVIPLAQEVIDFGIQNNLDQFAMYGFLNLGYAERELGKMEQARRSLEKVLDYGVIDHYAYNNLAELYLDLNQPDSAIFFSHKAMKSAGFDPGIPMAKLAEQALSYPDKAVFITLADDLARGYMARGERTSESEDLKIASNLYELLDTVIDELRMTTVEQQSRHFWRSEVKPVYDRAISASMLYGDADKAFYFSEKSKAVLLLDDIVKHASARGGNIPDSLLDEEFRLKQSIFDLELEMYRNGPKADSLSDKILAAKRQLNDLHLALATIAPQYVSTRYNQAVSGLKEWSGLNQSGKAAVSYIWSDDRIYRFAVGHAAPILDIIDLDSAFRAQLNFVIKTISRPTDRLDELRACHLASAAIYDKLLGGLGHGFEELTIFPDGVLYFLPFEALVINGDAINPKFLVEESVVYYGFSVNTMYARRQDAVQGPSLGFAPNTYAEVLDLQPLKYMEKELEGLRHGKVDQTIWLSDEDATRDSLLAAFEDASLIHIYSHAAANDTTKPYPWIAMRNDLLFLPEIYNHRTEADLVILSACETNLGKEVKGEGVISLARGFFHAGSNSVLASLWSVNDRSNAEIMANFYNYLADGRSKAEALRAAKLQFMDDFPLEATSPYHWAGLVYIGQDGPSPLNQGQTLWRILLISGILVSFVAFLGYLSKFRRNK